MGLKSRKEIRKEAESLSAELATLKTPQGLAAYMFSLRGDEAFEEAFRTEIEKLAAEDAADAADAVEGESDEETVEGFGDTPPLL